MPKVVRLLIYSRVQPHTEPFDTITANGIFDPDSVVTLTLGADDARIYDGMHLIWLESLSKMISRRLKQEFQLFALEESVTENDPDGNTNADFQIKADAVDTSSRAINISISQGDADFLSTGSLAIDEVTIPADARTVNLEVPIETDTEFEISGDITVTIQPSDGSSATYDLAGANTSASILVINDDFATSDQDNSVGILAIKDSGCWKLRSLHSRLLRRQ